MFVDIIFPTQLTVPVEQFVQSLKKVLQATELEAREKEVQHVHRTTPKTEQSHHTD